MIALSVPGLAALLLTASAWAQVAGPPIAIAGEFSNVRFNGEHAYGYTVQLWREGNGVFGFFLAQDGLAGDTPIGVLENIRFEPGSGKLTFAAKLSTGVTLLGNGEQRPSRDLFEFEGVLGSESLAGILSRSDLLSPTAVRTAIQVRLRKQDHSDMTQPRSHADWKRRADELLRHRGPKW